MKARTTSRRFTWRPRFGVAFTGERTSLCCMVNFYAFAKSSQQTGGANLLQCVLRLNLSGISRLRHLRFLRCTVFGGQVLHTEELGAICNVGVGDFTKPPAR